MTLLLQGFKYVVSQIVLTVVLEYFITHLNLEAETAKETRTAILI